MEESRLRGKGLYCFFIDFKKAFDMVPREHLWRRMEELEMTCVLAISQIYEKVICRVCVCVSDKLSDFFNSTIGVKQGCPLSPNLFGLCMDEFEEMVAKFVKEECVEEVATRNVVIMLLLSM